ncbi:hypothetical protein J1N35_037802 [Gossypium stocksii]|uniref:Reverse transcriptase zinc-binding domain-containing protein n=1 Tax=Gossypium stocksii TaxID=47602 RepID=A0A9D3UKZ6_9ROSI|nr:hypothetical protein J1N35_037802 [Gossypium stocksii]
MRLDCLLAHVMKAKYYQMSSFIRAKLGSYPSYTWCSILSTCRVIKEEDQWKVGSGASINIWRDPWLSGSRQAKVMGQCININYSYISDLSNMDSYTWKVDVLNRLFDNDQV